jgi:arogenate dehydrogenase (NADP+)
MLSKKEIKIGIIGLGLIGGSLAKVLANSGYPVYGVAHSDNTLKKATELEIFHEVSQQIEILEGCSVIFIATPINTIDLIFKKLAGTLKSPCIVTDVASIKAEIVQLAEKTFDPDRICFIAGHPMAGTEDKGTDAAFPDLFKGARWVLCPADNKRKAQINLLSDIISDTGAIVVYCNPQIHDLAVALISHMPLMVSMGLIESVNSQEDFVLKENAFYLAASGYRDTTRIAGGNARLTFDMLNYNKKNVLKALDIFEKSLKNLRETLDKPEEDQLEKYEEISDIRKGLYSDSGNNIFRGLSG